MRKAKRDRQEEARKPVVQHTRGERIHLRRKKRKEGPSALKRKEARAHLQTKTVSDG